jgi:hypothetical protein
LITKRFVVDPDSHYRSGFNDFVDPNPDWAKMPDVLDQLPYPSVIQPFVCYNFLCCIFCISRSTGTGIWNGQLTKNEKEQQLLYMQAAYCGHIRHQHLHSQISATHYWLSGSRREKIFNCYFFRM